MKYEDRLMRSEDRRFHLDRLRALTPEQRIVKAAELWETAKEVARAGIRAQNPQFSPEDVERELRRRIALAYDTA
ncbi:MAG: hypothetical protein ACE5R4_15045 [Armatimonadota bacterium]